MPEKQNYLRDLLENPRATSAQVCERVKASTVNAVETMFRKLQSAGLVFVENTKPRRYCLTDKGQRELKPLSEETSEKADGPQAPEEEIAPGRSRVKALLERAGAVLEADNHSANNLQTTTVKAHPRLLELLAVERGLSGLPRQELRKVRDSLRKQIGDEQTCERICRLAEAEVELSGEKSWWPDSEVVARLEAEIAELKQALSLSKEVTGLT